MSINPLNDISRVYLEHVAAVDEGMTMKDFKKQRSRQKQKEKRVADKIAPNRRKDIHTDRLSPERAARHRANVDPDFEGNDERNYPGGKLKNPKKIRKAKALGEIGESAVPGKPAERLGAVTAIPKSEQEAARERVLAKVAAIRAKKGIKTEAFVDPEQGEAPSGRSPLQNVSDHPKASVRKKAVSAFKKQMGKEYGGTWKSRSKDPVDEAAKPDYLDFDKDGNEKESMKKALKDKAKQKVEEAKKSNDGNLANNYPPFDKVTRGDVIAGALGKDQMGGKKKVTKEGYSNWREDLAEVMTDVQADKKITEKKVNNKITINPKLDLGEAVENLGGTLLEMVEIDEVDYIVESVYDELLDEGYEEDDIEEALEFALTEAKVTFGHDTPTGQKKRGNLAAAVGRLARQKLSSKVRSAKSAAKQAVASGARKVAKGALGVARKMEAGDKKSHTAERKPSTYRGAGAGTKERVSSGSYTPPTKKKAEKPSDPWEGSATTPTKPKAKKVAAPKAKAPAATTSKKKKRSKLDSLLADIRSEQVQIDEKTLTPAETKEKERIVKSMKDKASDFEKRYPGRGKEVMYATATKMAKKMAEQAMEIQPKAAQKPGQQDTAQKKAAQQKDRQKQQEVQILQRKLQALRSAPKGVDTDITAGYEPEGEMLDERRKEDKVAGTPRKPRNKAFELVAKSMGTGRMGVKPRGQKKEPGKKPPAAGEYGAPKSPAQKVAMRRAAAQRAQDMMHSPRD